MTGGNTHRDAFKVICRKALDIPTKSVTSNLDPHLLGSGPMARGVIPLLPPVPGAPQADLPTPELRPARTSWCYGRALQNTHSLRDSVSEPLVLNKGGFRGTNSGGGSQEQVVCRGKLQTRF